MGEQLTLTASDGHQLSAYVAHPASASKGGLVMIQEIFGQTEQMKRCADRYAAAGFTVAEERPITTSTVVSGDGSAWRNRLERSYSDRIAKLDEHGRADLEHALAEAFAPYRENDGYRVTTHAKIGIGSAPRG